MCSVIGQRMSNEVFVLEELVLANSNTYAACEAFLERTRPWVQKSRLPIPVRIYGDATGDSRNSAASVTDWQIVRDFFDRHTSLYEATFWMGASNPRVKDRVNCVNALLCNEAGERRLRFDPGCKQLIVDFERVHWKTDANGTTQADIDKSDRARTHLSDALGYMVATEFNMQGTYGDVGERFF